MTINKAIDLIVHHRHKDTTGEVKEALAMAIQALMTVQAMMDTWGENEKKGGKQHG